MTAHNNEPSAYLALGSFFSKKFKARRKFHQNLSSKQYQQTWNPIESPTPKHAAEVPVTDFRELVALYQHRVFNTVLSLLQNREDAEDVTQEVFIRVYQTLATFKGESSLSTWIYRISVNKALDFIKSKKTKKRFGLIRALLPENEANAPVVPDFVHPGVVLERKEQAAILFKAIEKLPEKQKIAFTLSKMEDLSYAEISAVMETTVSSVESLLFRAKQNLQQYLQQHYAQEREL
jgi:RNA polymerase sigma-70 factor (ECF subfamily)